jgi:hypothetical protein
MTGEEDTAGAAMEAATEAAVSKEGVRDVPLSGKKEPPAHRLTARPEAPCPSECPPDNGKKPLPG